MIVLIPHLHFLGNCIGTILLYEKAFNTKAETIITCKEYGSNETDAENRIAHAVMKIHGQKIFLNDRFGKKDNSTDVAVHLIILFPNKTDFLNCYEIMKPNSVVIDPLEELSYSSLAVQFIDKFGVQ